MILAKYEKQPAEVKDYDIDYAEWLGPVGDTVATATTTVACDTEPAPTLLVDSVETSDTLVKLWVSGGTAGARYKVTVLMTTTGFAGKTRTDESELVFTVKEY